MHTEHRMPIVRHSLQDTLRQLFSLATSLSITYPKWYVIAPSAVWACGVGFARMNQGVHYPSDVVAGAAIGVGCAFVNVYVNRWLNKVLFGRQIK